MDKGGGFVYVAGPVNTVQLAGPAEDEKTRLGPILQDLPVVPKDIRLEAMNRSTEKAWPLDFKDASADLLKFLKLKDETADEKFQDDWKDFFGPIQPDRSVDRGFYNFYPVESVTPAALVAAYFGDPEAKAKDPKGQTSLMPYIVVSNPADEEKRVIWVGWGEMWRLRQKNEAYLEHFWTKLTRYAGDLHHGKIIKRITPNFGKVFKSTDLINMEARIEGKGGEPLPEDARPVVKVTLESAVTTKMTDEDRDNLLKLQERAGVSPPQLQRRAELERKSKDKKITADEVKELTQLIQKQRNSDLTPVEKQQMSDLEGKARAEARQNKELEDLKKELPMKAKPQSEGWYQVQFKAPVAGSYSMELTVPETGDTMTHHFTVKPSDPEIDDPRPDFDRLYEAASYADQYLPTRMAPAEYADLLQKLERPKLEESQADDRPRLYFTLANADQIPQCMRDIEHKDVHADDARYVWGESVAAPTAVGDRWVPWWAALPLGVGLVIGCLVCSSLAGVRQWRGMDEARQHPWAALLIGLAALDACFCVFAYLRWGMSLHLAAAAFLVCVASFGAYFFACYVKLTAWIVCILVAAVLVPPVFLPPAFALGWYAFTALVAVMCLEWAVRKLLRLA